MSYFMTIGGRLRAADQPPDLVLVPAKDAQAYVAALEPELFALDGGPVTLVDDGESGTSDVAVADLVSALEDDADISSLPIFKLMIACASSGASFRIWWAGGDDPSPHKSRVVEAFDMDTAIQALKSGRGVCWRHREAEVKSNA